MLMLMLRIKDVGVSLGDKGRVVPKTRQSVDIAEVLR